MTEENLLVTKVEATSENNTTDIHLFGRRAGNDEKGERHEVVVEDYSPYFFVPQSEIGDDVHSLIGANGITSIKPADRSGFNYNGDLMRVTVERPRDLRNAKHLFNKTFGADVSVENRYRIETGIKDWIEANGGKPKAVEGGSSDLTPRVCTLDIEVDDRGGFPDPGEKRITSITAHDSYEDEVVGFIDLDNREVNDAFPDGKPEEVDKLHFEPDERRMLIRFACWIAEHDVDVLTAWNSDFDYPYLIARMEEVGVNPSRMSPLGSAEIDYRDRPKVSGRSIYDLLQAYKNNSWGNLRSYSLDYVAGKELGESKIEHEMGFYEMWQQDPTKFINYNARDTDLAVGINEKAEVIEFRDTLRKQVGVNFEDTVNNYQFIEMMVRRKLKERGEVGPTADPENAEGYEGAFVFEPHDGVAENVVCIDVSSLYPWTMYMLNASPETKVNPDEKGAEGDVAIAPNGAAFSLDQDGLFRELVEEAIGLKSEYGELKEEAAAAGNDELHKKYSIQYASSKTITNSIYGVIGWDKFFLYDKDIAEAVTLAGQEVIKATADYIADDTVGEVIYGDTDSCYISFPEHWNRGKCVEHAHEICDELEQIVYPNIAEKMNIPAEDCKWEIGPEIYTPRFFQYGKKKKYAYQATWKEGMDHDEVISEPKTTIKGSAVKRSDASRLTRDTEKACIMAILNGEASECNELVYEAALKLNPDEPDWDAIGIPGGIGKELDNYDSETAHVRAARHANELCGANYGKGSKPQRCYIQPAYMDSLGEKIDVIAYENESDLQPIIDDITINANRMTETLIINPLEDILDAVGVDVDAAISGTTQTGLDNFF